MGSRPAPVTGYGSGASERFASSSRRARASTSRPEPAPVSTTTSPSSDATTRPRTRASVLMSAATSVVDRGRHDPLRRVDLADAAVEQDRQPVAEPDGLVQVVRDQHARGVGPDVEPLEVVEQLGAGRAVEGHERLVEEQQLRLQHEGTREAGPLRLAARELARRSVPQVGDPEPLQPVLDPLAGLDAIRRPGSAGRRRRSRRPTSRAAAATVNTSPIRRR